VARSSSKVLVEIGKPLDCRAPPPIRASNAGWMRGQNLPLNFSNGAQPSKTSMLAS